MMSLKLKLMLILCGVLFVGIPLVLWTLQPGTPKKTPIPIIAPTPTRYIPEEAPNGRIKIGDVTMHNFVKNAQRIDAQNDVFFINTPEYEVVYLNPFNEFLITIKQTPFDENRIRAEQDLLRTLDITEEDACKLQVTIGMPGFVDPEYTGRNFPLSFCQ